MFKITPVNGKLPPIGEIEAMISGWIPPSKPFCAHEYEQIYLGFDYLEAAEKLDVMIEPFREEYRAVAPTMLAYADISRLVIAIHRTCPSPSLRAVHELAHCLLHHNGRPLEDPYQSEIEAESVTWAIGMYYGHDLLQCRDYISEVFSEGGEKPIKPRLMAVHRSARKLLQTQGFKV